MSESGGISFDHTVMGVVSFNVKPNELDSWRQQWEGIAHQARATEGCQFFDLAKSTREEGTYVIVTAWKPGNKWLAFIQSIPELREISGGVWSSPLHFYVVLEEGKPSSW